MHPDPFRRACYSLVGTVLLGTVLWAVELVARSVEVDPHAMYAAVWQHLAACRVQNFPAAYQSAASEVQEHFTLVQYEHMLREDLENLAGTRQVEFGAVRATGKSPTRATVDVYFVLGPRGEVLARRYLLVREDELWKVDSSAPLAGRPVGPRVRLVGLKL